MATLRERFTSWRRTDELNRQLSTLTESLTLALNAVSDPQWTTPQDLAAQLREYDAEYLDLLIDQLGWEQLGGGAPSADRERKAAVDGSRQAWRTASPLAQWAIWTWTAHGLGDAAIELTAEDEQAQPVIDEFWTADRNAVLLGHDNLHTLSERLLVDGNVFLSFFASTVDGLATVRVIPQEEIEIITNPDDSLVPWFYKRTFRSGVSGRELYYPAWSLVFGDEDTIQAEEAWSVLVEKRLVSPTAQRADQAQNGQLGESPGTDVCVLHIAHNRKDPDSLWGWPILTIALPWIRTHKRFMQARFTVALAVAQFVRRSKVDGGSRAVASVIDQIASNLSRSQYTDTNPPGAAGGWHVENQAVDTSELPMRTGASDAKLDNDAFSWMAGIGMGLNTTTMGLDTARYATAVQMDKVQSFLFAQYRQFWQAQFQYVARIVLSFVDKYGNQTFTNMTIQTSIDPFGMPDFPDIVNTGTQLIAELTNAVNAGVLPGDAAARIDARLVEVAMQALGVSDAAELTSDEAFEIGDFAPEEEPEPEPPPMIPMMPVEQPEIPAMEAILESHEGTRFDHTCPLCGHTRALYYEGHGGLVVCEGCHKTYDPAVE